MEKLKMRVYFGVAINHPLNQDYFEVCFYLKGDYEGREGVLRANGYTEFHIDFDGYQYGKYAKIEQVDRISERSIAVEEKYLKEIFEMAEHDVEVLDAEFEDIDVYNESKEKIREILKVVKGVAESRPKEGLSPHKSIKNKEMEGRYELNII
jgi:hypothetical protein